MNNYNIDFSINSCASSSAANSCFDIVKDDKKNITFSFASELQSDSIFQLAKAFLSIESMTHKKLQKLCYYAKAWYLALYDTNLVTEPFQAWVHGAVQPALYHHYKRYGYSMIPKVEETKDIPEEFMSFAHEVFDSYGHLTGDELEAINHLEDPWKNARGTCQPWESCENVISENDMKLFYRKML